MDNQPQYEIAGEWMATSASPDCLEVARTARTGVIAMRPALAPEQILLTAPGRLRDAMRALETKDEFRELVSS